MTTISFRSSQENPSADEIRIFRRFTNLGISEIRRRAKVGQSLLQIVAFENNWQENRGVLAEIVRGMFDGTLPFLASEVVSGVEEDIDTERLQARLKRLRDIELETQLHTSLELGEIKSISEFAPYDDDWTVI